MTGVDGCFQFIATQLARSMCLTRLLLPGKRNFRWMPFLSLSRVLLKIFCRTLSIYRGVLYFTLKVAMQLCKRCNIKLCKRCNSIFCVICWQTKLCRCKKGLLCAFNKFLACLFPFLKKDETETSLSLYCMNGGQGHYLSKDGIRSCEATSEIFCSYQCHFLCTLLGFELHERITRKPTGIPICWS